MLPISKSVLVAASTLVIGLAAVPTASAVTQDVWFLNAPGDSCQLSLPTIDTVVRPRANGYRNEGTAAGEARALAYVSEVNDLCALAGCPEKAAEFIGKKVAVADVRSALLGAKASKTDADTVVAHQPGKGAQAGDHGWSKIAAATGAGTGYSPAGRPAKR